MLVFFFLMIRPPPRSTLFPTRRSSDLCLSLLSLHLPRLRARDGFSVGRGNCFGCRRQGCLGRSEEHTSELQSHHDLVCRLLLEKKNTRKTMSATRTNSRRRYCGELATA